LVLTLFPKQLLQPIFKNGLEHSLLNSYEAIEKVRTNLDKIKTALPGFVEGYNKKTENLKNELIEAILEAR
jgi:flagellar capping protein FliD